MSGKVSSQHVYGVWVTLNELPEVPALLELIHFEMIESHPEKRIQFPEDYPVVGSVISCRILGWCLLPKDVRLTQLSHLHWCKRPPS